MPLIHCPRGQRVAQSVAIKDPSTGRLDARWLATDTPVARVWGGQERQFVALTAAWDGVPETAGAKILLTVTEAVSADLADGRWRVDFQVTRSGVTTAVNADSACYLVIAPGSLASSAEDEPRSYITGREFRDTVGPYPDTLQTKYGQTSNLQALNLATLDLDGLIAQRYAKGDPTLESEMLASLAAGGLTVTVAVKRYTAYRALWHLLAWTPGGGDDLAGMRERAAEEAGRALGQVVAYVDGVAVATFGGRAVRIER